MLFRSNGAETGVIDGLVADFIRSYLTFYVPEAFRTVFPFDVEFFHAVHRAIIPRSKKKKVNSIEANNLVVEEENINEIRSCLGPHISLGTYLSQGEIKGLQTCGVDISRINPGVSALWKKLKPEEVENIHTEVLDEFPDLDAELQFRRIILRGQGSPKIKASFVSSTGKTKFLKIKIGNEAHTDRSASKLFELGGFNQDQMVYRKQIKVLLGKTSYEEFEALFANKYSRSNIQRFIQARGGEQGAEWIILNDVILEAKPESELRLGPVDFGNWDLQNRREYRGYILYLAWLGLMDLKLANFRFCLREHEGSYYPLVRLQDLGYSFAVSTIMRKPKSIMTLNKAYLVNEFNTKFLKFDRKKKRIKILWNDYGWRSRNFQAVSYYDLKWMARKIASVSSDDIYRSMIDSGMPEPIAKVLHLKLLHRRNHMIEAFELENEIPQIAVPKLKEFNPYPNMEDPPVVDGKVVKKAFEGKNNIVHLKETWATLLIRLASFDIPISSFTNSDSGAQVATGLQGLEKLKLDLGFVSAPDDKSKIKIPLGVGVQAVLGRSVVSNNQTFNFKGKNHLFKIVDQVSIRFDLDSPVLRALVKKAKNIQFAAGIRFFEKNYRLIHYSDSASEGYRSPFILHKVISNIPKFAAYHLKLLEVIKTYKRIGVEFEGGVGVYSFNPLVKNELSSLIGERNELASYYFRDQYHRLHVFNDQVSLRAAGFNLDILSASLLGASLPLLKIHLGSNKFHLKTKDLIFDLPTLDRDYSEEYLTPMRRKREYQALQCIEKGSLSHYDLEDKFDFIKTNYSFDSMGKLKTNDLGFLWFFVRDRNKGGSKAKAILADEKSREFMRFFSLKNNSFGLEHFSLVQKDSDILVKSRKRVRIDTEIDLKNIEKFVAAIRTEDFYISKSKAGLEKLIQDLNRRYSESTEVPFYRDYTLPDVEEVNKYPKIYALTRIFVNGEKLIKFIPTMDDTELTARLNRHFKIGKGLHINLAKKLKVVKVKKILSKIAKILGRQEQKEKIKQIAKLYQKLLQSLDTEIYGIGFLRDILGPENIYAMSEVSGVLASFTTMQDIQVQQRRRFMAHSWGQYHRSPPIQRFLRYHRLVPASAHIDKLIPDSTALGFLEVGVAPDLFGTFNRNGSF